MNGLKLFNYEHQENSHPPIRARRFLGVADIGLSLRYTCDNDTLKKNELNVTRDSAGRESWPVVLLNLKL